MIDVQPKTTDVAAKELAPQPDADVSVVRERAKLFGEIMRENGYNMMPEVVPFDTTQYIQ